MGKPRISVVMPAYNAAQYVAASIESVLSQTYGDFELLIVCDPSTDDTEKIIESYADRDGRVRLLKNVHPKGVGGALNTGLENSRGEFIARADADDLNRPYRFQKQIEFLDKHPEIFLLGGGFAPFKSNGFRYEIFHPSSSMEIAWRCVSNTYFAHPTVMFRRVVFETVGGYPNVEAEDFSYFSDVVKTFRCANLPMVLIDYRESMQNRSLVYAADVEKSVKNKCIENFRYYVGNLESAEKFYEYQNRNVLRVSDLVKISLINRKIIVKIRKKYGLSAFDGDVAMLYLVIIRDYFRKSCFTYLRIDPKYLYVRIRSKLKKIASSKI